MRVQACHEGSSAAAGCSPVRGAESDQIAVAGPSPAHCAASPPDPAEVHADNFTPCQRAVLEEANYILQRMEVNDNGMLNRLQTGNTCEDGGTPVQSCNTCSFTEEEQQSLQQAMLVDMSESHGASCTTLPWLAVSDENFCSILLAMLPQDQAHRVVCAAVSILRLRLDALAVPVKQSVAATVQELGTPWLSQGSLPQAAAKILIRVHHLEAAVGAGARHPLPVARLVLASLLTRPGLNAHQAELVIKTLKECGPTSMLLAAETLAAVAEAQDWGMAFNDSTAAALMYILKLRPDISQVTTGSFPICVGSTGTLLDRCCPQRCAVLLGVQDTMRGVVTSVCLAASQPSLRPSLKFAKLLMSLVAAYPAQCRLLHGQLAQAASNGTSVISKTCAQKVDALLT